MIEDGFLDHQKHFISQKHLYEMSSEWEGPQSLSFHNN